MIQNSRPQKRPRYFLAVVTEHITLFVPLTSSASKAPCPPLTPWFFFSVYSVSHVYAHANMQVFGTNTLTARRSLGRSWQPQNQLTQGVQGNFASSAGVCHNSTGRTTGIVTPVSITSFSTLHNLQYIFFYHRCPKLGLKGENFKSLFYVTSCKDISDHTTTITGATTPNVVSISSAFPKKKKQREQGMCKFGAALLLCLPPPLPLQRSHNISIPLTCIT